MFRELGYGVLFFACAMVGTFLIGPLLFIGPSSSHEERARQVIKVMVFGPPIGGGAWLWIRYKYLRRPKEKPE